MITFCIIAALLTLAALLFVLPPLLRKDLSAEAQHLRCDVNLTVLRDQLRELDADLAAGVIDEQGYAVSKQELERRALDELLSAEPENLATVSTSTPTSSTTARRHLQPRLTALVVSLIVPLLAVGLYLLLGKPAGLDPAQTQAKIQEKASGDAAPAVTREQVTKMVADLTQELKERPDDVKGWTMLARTYGALGQYAESAQAYAHLTKIVPDDADVLANYADALGMSLNRSLQGQPEKIINQALAIDPNNIRALALSGGASFEREDFKAAIKTWKKMLDLLPRNSEIAQSTLNSIQEAQSKLDAGSGRASASAPSSRAAEPQSPATVSNAAASTVSGTVSLDPALRGQVADNDSVFIFARASQGPRFPLAVLRKQVKDLPVTFTLDDSMSMMPEAKLSGFSSVVVGARISKSGSATPTAGDLEGLTESVKPGVKGLKIVINQRRN